MQKRAKGREAAAEKGKKNGEEEIAAERAACSAAERESARAIVEPRYWRAVETEDPRKQGKKNGLGGSEGPNT